jgi:hypothetical protein
LLANHAPDLYARTSLGLDDVGIGRAREYIVFGRAVDLGFQRPAMGGRVRARGRRRQQCASANRTGGTRQHQ